MKFEYQALDDKGQTHRGTEEAHNLEAFLKILFKRRLFPVEIKKLNPTDLKLADEMDHLKKLRDKLEGNTTPTEPEYIPEPHKPARKELDWAMLGNILLITIIISTAIASYIFQ